MLRSAILDALAHEIKTPLAAILTAAGGIRARGAMEPEQAELAELIENEAARLGELTSRLLRTARLDSEEIRPRLERVSVAELASESVERYAKSSPGRRIALSAASAACEVRADPELVLLALGQLLENACRYSRPDSTVRVETAADGDWAAITVINEGDPIPPAERGRIFERFFRGGAARHAPGTGLGLHVARRIALAHGGDITLMDAGERAVALRLSLPAAESEAPHD
jgi:two-component system sensor histidine kinase KdpD